MHVNEAYPLFLHTLLPHFILMAEITLIKLAPWIMIGITLWGLGRLFRPGERAGKSDAQDEQDGDERYEYEDDEIEDEYDEYDQEE